MANERKTQSKRKRTGKSGGLTQQTSKRSGTFYFKPHGIHDKGIGANSYMYGYKDEAGRNTTVVVDNGTFLGSDPEGKYAQIMPANIDTLKKLNRTNGAVFYTHAHVDHFGADAHMKNLGVDLSKTNRYGMPLVREGVQLQYIMGRIPTWNWPKFTINPKNNSDLDPRGTTTVGPFKVESVKVGHSIPARGFYMETPNGVGVFHSGDMRMVKDDRHDNTTDMEHLNEIIKRGKLKYLVVDATHWSVPGSDQSYDQTKKAIGDFYDRNKGKRAVVGVLSSSLPLVATYMEEAIKRGKTVIVHGGYMEMQYKAAKKAGFDYTGKDNEINPKTGVPYIVGSTSKLAANLKPEDTVVFTTGAYLGDNSRAVSFAEGKDWDKKRVSVQIPPPSPGRDVFVASRTPYPDMVQEWQQMKEGIKKIQDMGFDVAINGSPDSEMGKQFASEFPGIEVAKLSNGGHMKEDDAKNFLGQIKKFAKDAGVEPPIVVPHHVDAPKMDHAIKLATELGLESYRSDGESVIEFGLEGARQIKPRPEKGLEYIGVRKVPYKDEKTGEMVKPVFGGPYAYDLIRYNRETKGFEFVKTLAEPKPKEMEVASQGRGVYSYPGYRGLQREAGFDKKVAEYGQPKPSTTQMLARKVRSR